MGRFNGKRDNTVDARLDPAQKRRLIWGAILLGAVIFAVGTASFAFFFALGSDPGADRATQDSSAPDDGVASEQADAPVGAPIDGQIGGQIDGQVAVQTGGEFVHAVPSVPETFNPLFATDAAAQLAVDLLFPRLVGQDPTSGLPTPTALATGWEIAPDGRTYTFDLRAGVRWSDGTPVTAADFLYTYTALGAAQTESPFQSRAALIESIQAPDPQTLVITLRGPHCAALHSLRHPLLPSHRYAADFGDLVTNPLNQTPEVSAGPFVFVEHEPGARIVLARNPDYWQGAPHLDRYILQVSADPDQQAAQLAAQVAAGEVDLAPVAAEESAQFAAVANANAQLFQHPQAGYLFLAANLADPNAAQPGLGEDGALVAQTPHPILGEVSVRRALALAIDRQNLLRVAAEFGAESYLLDGYLLPTIGWANLDAPAALAHDPEQAAQLLDAAGWRADAEGLRSRDGTRLALRLMTNADNPRRVALAQAIAADFTALGVQIRLEPLAFEEMTATLLEQRFDLSLGGWENLSPDPALQPLWHSRDDVPGRGFNFTSFQDPQVDSWLDQAATAADCAPAARGQLYAQVQTRVQEQLPYLLMLGDTQGWAAGARWRNLAPGPWQLHHNVRHWGLPE